MANRFWVGDGGNWSDNTNHWSASTGGAPNASLPTSSDSVYFDAASFTVGSQTVTVDATAYCLDMDWTGATNTPELAVTNSIFFYGSTTTIANMTITGAAGLVFNGGGSDTLTTNGLSLGCRFVMNAVGTITLQDALTITNTAANALSVSNGVFDTNGMNVTVAGTLVMANAPVKTVTLGSSVVACGAWNYSGTNLTLTANTATINCSGNFAGGGITTYNIVNLTGATSTVSGSNTFATLALPAATTQTITFTAGSIQTITTATLSGDATHAHALKSGTAGTLASLIATTLTDDYVTYTDMRLSWETLTVKEIYVYNRELSFAETENIRLATY